MTKKKLEIDIKYNNVVMDRLKSLLGYEGFGSDMKLARYLNKTQAAVSNWRNFSEIDWRCLQRKISPEWFYYILTGNDFILSVKPQKLKKINQLIILLADYPEFMDKFLKILEGKKTQMEIEI